MKDKKISKIDVVLAKTPSLPMTPLGRLFEVGKAAQFKKDMLKHSDKTFAKTGIVGRSRINTKKTFAIINRPGVGAVKIIVKDNK